MELLACALLCTGHTVCVRPLYLVDTRPLCLRAPPTSQAVVLEGKYWRRKIDAVAEEYHKWRLWYQMKRKRQHHTQVGEARQQETATGPATTSDMMHWDLNLGA